VLFIYIFMDDIFNILSFLPIEIINIIIPYTYEPQSNALTNDIKNFFSTKATANKLYYERFVIELNEPEPSDKDWFINDLFRFSNQSFPTIFGYVDNLYSLFFRNFSVKINREVLTYIQKIETREVSTQINIFWGLFTLEERKSFLRMFFPNHTV